MVAFLINCSNTTGDVPAVEAEVQEVLTTGVRPYVEPAPPEGLVLWDVRYPPSIAWRDLDGCLDQVVKAFQPRVDAHEILSVQDKMIMEKYLYIKRRNEKSG